MINDYNQAKYEVKAEYRGGDLDRTGAVRRDSHSLSLGRDPTRRWGWCLRCKMKIIFWSGPTRDLTVSQSTQFPPPSRQSRPSCRRDSGRGPSEDLTARTPPCSGADRPADRPVWTPPITCPASGRSWRRRREDTPDTWGGSTALPRSLRASLHRWDDEEMF